MLTLPPWPLLPNSVNEISGQFLCFVVPLGHYASVVRVSGSGGIEGPLEHQYASGEKRIVAKDDVIYSGLYRVARGSDPGFAVYCELRARAAE